MNTKTARKCLITFTTKIVFAVVFLFFSLFVILIFYTIGVVKIFVYLALLHVFLMWKKFAWLSLLLSHSDYSIYSVITHFHSSFTAFIIEQSNNTFLLCNYGWTALPSANHSWEKTQKYIIKCENACELP